MIMDLPKNFKGNGYDVFIENGILKLNKRVPFRKLVYSLTYELKGGKHRCLYCNRTVSYNKVTLDHIFPQDMGGPTITNNLLPCCKKCNSEKSNLTSKEYKFFLSLDSKKEKRQFFKKVQREKNWLRELNLYQIPNEWLSEHEVSHILLFMQLDNPEDYQKYKRVKEFYEKYHYFQKPIIIDKNGFLLDGYYIVIYAKNHNIPSLKAIELENVEVFF